MTNHMTRILSEGWGILRLIAVVSSSVTAVLSSLLPLLLYTSHSPVTLFYLFLFLCGGAIVVHGLLTHLFNDYADFTSGTDEHSPAILSGGSRVIQKGIMTPQVVWWSGVILTMILLIFAGLMAFVGQAKVTFLIVIGIWSAISYSLSPLRLSYRPFWGEWLSLFPAMFFLGIAGPWLILDSIPMWAIQNAVINALICMAWVMVHHIPDLEADQKAVPVKETTVVWFTNRFNSFYARVPALIYLSLAGLCTVWIAFSRIGAALSLIILIGMASHLVIKLKVGDHEQVTQSEKGLLLLAMVIGLVLGIW